MAGRDYVVSTEKGGTCVHLIRIIIIVLINYNNSYKMT